MHVALLNTDGAVPLNPITAGTVLVSFLEFVCSIGSGTAASGSGVQRLLEALHLAFEDADLFCPPPPRAFACENSAHGDVGAKFLGQGPLCELQLAPEALTLTTVPTKLFRLGFFCGVGGSRPLLLAPPWTPTVGTLPRSPHVWPACEHSRAAIMRRTFGQQFFSTARQCNQYCSTSKATPTKSCHPGTPTVRPVITATYHPRKLKYHPRYPVHVHFAHVAVALHFAADLAAFSRIASDGQRQFQDAQPVMPASRILLLL
eukprot:m.114784 g.114784  ORF g.114784 m.114784 type:complete len:260 (+) comp17126_c0_seq1:1548-2327(+)